MIRQSRIALVRQNFPLAEDLGRRLAARPGRAGATGWLVVGEALAHQGFSERALEALAQIPAEQSSLAPAGHAAAGEILADRMLRITPAVDELRRVLEFDSLHLPTHERLSYLLGIAGQSRDALPHRLAMLRRGRFSPVHLVLLALGGTADENPETVRRYFEARPDDPLALCGMARVRWRENRLDEAMAMLERAVASRPMLFEAQSWLGTLYLQTGRIERYQTWQNDLPTEAEESPEIWFVRGTWAQHEGDLPVAARCFAEAVQRDPNYQVANYQLSQVLVLLGDESRATPIAERARLLGDLIVVGKTWQLSGSAAVIEQGERVCDALGLDWEARSWRSLLGQASPPLSAGRRDEERESEPNRDVGTPAETFALWRKERTRLPAEYAAAIHDLAFPLPSGKRAREILDGSRLSAASSAAAVRFREDAFTSGIDFTFVNGSRPATAGEYMYEFSGGGVAVLDLEGDGLPDLYFTQGTDWPPDPRQTQHLDRLYRNLGAGRFADVTSEATIFENRFSQGPSVGDIDNDGFADLFVGNLGRNGLFRSNGDGTFTDVSAAAGIAGESWTVSCAIADFNGDTWPDIYEVNYVIGGELFERPCLLKDGSPRLCTPHEFPAAQDRLYLSLGDGRFRDATLEAGLVADDGKGLGIIACDFDHSGRLSLFVANDSVPNFFFINETVSPGGAPRFSERGFLTGLAVNADGLSQACMGVACGDADGNGFPDLFVTNFYHESTTLYLQQAESLFVDATRVSGLHDPSYEMLGFGTQFIDGDLDGRPDLVVVNGHVGNLSQHGVPYKMRAQYFRNSGRGRFEELSATSLGEYFEQKHLGRGLARGDWNGDGKMDLAVSHLDERAAILTNVTPGSGNFLAVRLCGVRSSRDAIGARVTVTAGDLRQTQQLVAGDGYEASNQRLLLFGLGDRQQVDSVEIHWPSGAVDREVEIPAGTHLLVIEGRSFQR